MLFLGLERWFFPFLFFTKINVFYCFLSFFIPAVVFGYRFFSALFFFFFVLTLPFEGAKKRQAYGRRRDDCGQYSGAPSYCTVDYEGGFLRRLALSCCDRRSCSCSSKASQSKEDCRSVSKQANNGKVPISCVACVCYSPCSTFLYDLLNYNYYTFCLCRSPFLWGFFILPFLTSI